MKNISKSTTASYHAGFLQFDVKLGEPAANLAALRAGLARLAPAGPGIIVLPELWSCGFAYGQLQHFALQTVEVLEEMQRLAGEYAIYLAGSLPEEVLTEVDSAIYNTLYIVGPEGVVGSIRKQQLFAPMGEDRHFSPGGNPQPVETGLGLVGGLVCYDLRFPELVRSQAAKGAQLLLVSAQWPAARREHWRTLAMARAIENQIFVVACNRCGVTGATEFGGHSLVIGPDGTILAEGGVEPDAAWVGIDPAVTQELRQRFNTVGVTPYRFNDQDKIMELEELAALTARYRTVGRKVVFTNGCFDILHQGHVTYLEQARGEGDCLVVGVNSDGSVRRLGKGDDRPVNHEQSRARILAALGCVDHVVIFTEETPQNLIAALMPDVLVKGGDWPVEKIVGAPEVLAAGGRVLSIPLVENYSTTSLLKKIRS
ncbi:D-glycero-beta-D-manno-heptose 1-phosphate adenylyltransferase [Thiovibrio frasassiensis]|uniref:D-glycero-beta-D-manno-heptose 1-phosphate adenylyltransferase n=1 Tax=Thiovibrio frasassiensis TaxID=2984131 RepID=A0A9X4RLS3_9BACT|nr:D-glycero-beta-D-manno-heptose 1-phosphate adenylyltransferase [Thiovibrio frasassiensis]MDG4475463.1 D-glycero-beta-D-manno-heptose 1-phosphate adenylyltransferase [Thiovibrio frasassiensis]